MKTFTPSGKSAIRVAILDILQYGKTKKIAEDDRNVSKNRIDALAIKLPKKFTPAQLKSGAKFVRDIRDKTKFEGELVFPQGSQKYDALTYFAKELTSGKLHKEAKDLSAEKSYQRSLSRVELKSAEALKTASRSLKGKVMRTIPVMYMVLVQEGEGKMQPLGAYSTPSSARAGARAFIQGIKKAYDPLIPVLIRGVSATTGRPTTRRAKLKIESRLKKGVKSTSKDYGSAKFFFENNQALKYLKENMAKKAIKVFVKKITDTKEHRAYWKLFNSPSVGKMQWNPHCKNPHCKNPRCKNPHCR